MMRARTGAGVCAITRLDVCRRLCDNVVMAKNPYGGRSGNLEWGDKARKAEDALRGLNHRADREAIAEQVAELDDDHD